MKVVVIFILLAIVGFVGFELSQLITLELVKENAASFVKLVNKNFLSFTLIFFSGYTLICASPLPLVAISTLLAGAIFGIWPGLLFVSISNTIGGLLTFYIARKFGKKYLEKVIADYPRIGNWQDSASSLSFALSMRFVLTIPFFITNVGLGLSRVTTKNFCLSTQLGMLTVLFILVNAGANLVIINSIDDVLDTQLIISLALVGTLPFILKSISKYFTETEH